MTISHHDLAPGVVAVTLSGRVTLGSSGEEIVFLTEELLRQGKRTIIFDLAGVAGLDSTGIGCFISSFNKIAAVRGEMRMAGATKRILQVFHVSQLDTVFPFFATLEDAARI